MFKRTMKKLSGSKNRASWSWGRSWPRQDRLQVMLTLQHPSLTHVLLLSSRMFLFALSFNSWKTHSLLRLVSRAGWSSEICEAFPDFHQQGQSGPAGPLPAGPVSWHGGSNRAGSRAVSWVHWVGQSWEEDFPTTGPGGEENKYNFMF